MIRGNFWFFSSDIDLNTICHLYDRYRQHRVTQSTQNHGKSPENSSWCRRHRNLCRGSVKTELLHEVDTVAQDCDPRLGRLRQENYEFVISLSYAISSSTTWAMYQNPVSKTNTTTTTTCNSAKSFKVYPRRKSSIWSQHPTEIPVIRESCTPQRSLSPVCPVPHRDPPIIRVSSTPQRPLSSTCPAPHRDPSSTCPAVPRDPCHPRVLHPTEISKHLYVVEIPVTHAYCSRDLSSTCTAALDPQQSKCRTSRGAVSRWVERKDDL